MGEQALPIQPELLTTEQAAQLCGVSPRHFESLAAGGKIGPQPVRLGRAVRWPRAELVAWIGGRCPSREQWIQSAEQSARRPDLRKTG